MLAVALAVSMCEACLAAGPATGTSEIFLAATDPGYQHKIGRAYSGTSPAFLTPRAWEATTADGPGFLSFGPYLTSIPTGISTVTFVLVADDNSNGEDAVAWIDVYDATNGKQLTKRRIHRNDFRSPMQPQDFDLSFEIDSPVRLEFRVYSEGKSTLRHLSTTVRPDRIDLNDLWNGSAHFEPIREVKFKSIARRFSSWQIVDPAIAADGETASLVALDGVWYAFNRSVIGTPKAVCSGNLLGTVVRKTEDKGRTWSNPIPVAIPLGCKTGMGESEGASCQSVTAPPDACAITDGGAFFDAESDTWHLLSQCLDNRGQWNLCHYTRAGASPMGAFAPDHENPVVRGNDLFKRICAGSSKHCDPKTRDEGTAQIIMKQGGYFYVSFHGALYAERGILGVRGIARTADFRTWETAGVDLPGDALLSAADCTPWHVSWNEGGCIGTGAASTIRSRGMFYVLAEAADISLACTKGQNWDFGLFRNARLGPSGSWENYAANPLVTNSLKAPTGCALQYMNVFRDRGDVFLMFSHYAGPEGFASSIFELTTGQGLRSITTR